MTKKQISEYFSKIGKLSYKKHPKTKEEYSAMGKKRWVRVIHNPPLQG